MIRTVCAAAAMILIAAPAFAQQVTFTCELTGGGSNGQDGFDIYSANPGPGSKTCTAACTVTLKSGEKKTWTYRSRTVNVARKAWFGGESAVSGAPLRDPKIDDSATSCQ
jgi:hypothetical protein